MTTIRSVEKDFLATAQDSFKDGIFICQIENYMHTKFEERKVPQAASGSFAQILPICFIICRQNS